MHFVFELPYEPPLRDLALFALATVALTALLGGTSAGPALARSPLASLREAELRGAG